MRRQRGAMLRDVEGGAPAGGATPISEPGHHPGTGGRPPRRAAHGRRAAGSTGLQKFLINGHVRHARSHGARATACMHASIGRPRTQFGEKYTLGAALESGGTSGTTWSSDAS